MILLDEEMQLASRKMSNSMRFQHLWFSRCQKPRLDHICASLHGRCPKTAVCTSIQNNRPHKSMQNPAGERFATTARKRCERDLLSELYWHVPLVSTHAFFEELPCSTWEDSNYNDASTLGHGLRVVLGVGGGKGSAKAQLQNQNSSSTVLGSFWVLVGGRALQKQQL